MDAGAPGVDVLGVGQLVEGQVGQAGLLGDQGDHVHAEPGHTLVQPEPHQVEHGGRHVGMIPVEVGLLGGEVVEVPLARPLVVGPGRTAEERGVVVGRPAVHPVTPDVPVPVGVVPGGAALHEPLVLVAGVVDHQIDDEADATLGEPGQEPVEVVHGAELGHDPAVVPDVVTVVGVGAVEMGAEPHHIHSQLGDVVEPADDAVQVADPVSVRVHERPRVHLVHHRVFPPRHRSPSWPSGPAGTPAGGPR